MLSNHFRAVPQPGQRDEGQTSDSCRGSRWMQTFRKLPTASPNSVTSSAAAVSGITRSAPR